jgi:hypothetical protein
MQKMLIGNNLLIFQIDNPINNMRIRRFETIFDHVIVVFRQFFPDIRENGPKEYALWRSCIEISNRLNLLNLLS